jgi:hypothetical protein
MKMKIVTKCIMLYCAVVTLVLSFAFSAPRGSGKDSVAVPSRERPLEIPDDEYFPVSRDAMPRSQAYSISMPGFFSVQVNVDSLGQNIVGDAANEPTIAVDPNNLNRMAIGWRQFNTVTNNFRQAGYGYTTDGGHTWKFPGVIQPGIFRSDPVFDSDADGSFYYNSLTTSGSLYLCDVFKSTSGGAAWGTGTAAHGGDKQWMIIDKSGGIGNGNVYSDWTSNFSSCPPGFFTRSSNRNASYENCIVIPSDPYWGTLAVGPSGELYVCGVGGSGFVVAKSTTARDSSRAVSWDTTTSVNLDGQAVAFAGNSSPNPSGLHGQAWIAVDRSNGSTRGNVYVLCSVGRTSVADPLDVMFARSTNGGRTWSAPVRVNDDVSTTAWQWFGTMSVAPSGRIDVVWLDTRDNPGSINSSLYYTYSTNAGLTWSPNVRLSQSFDPHAGWPQQNKMGDYFHMVSDNTGASLAWAATFGGEQNVYYGRISYPFTGIEDQVGQPIPSSFSLSQNYPNPFSAGGGSAFGGNPTTTIRFSFPSQGISSAKGGQPAAANALRLAVGGSPRSADLGGAGEGSVVTLKVYDLLGREVATLVNEVKQPGTYTVQWDARLRSANSGGQASDVASGVYFYRLIAGEHTLQRKMLLLR